MLAHAEDVEPHLIGKLHLLDQLPQTLPMRSAGGHVSKGVNANLQDALAFGAYMYLH